jgi:hypothetical protein
VRRFSCGEQTPAAIDKEPLMSKTETETVIIKQTVHRPHNETVVRRWYDVVEITLRRDVDPDGYMVWQEEEEEVTDWEVDLEEETLATDVDAGDDEVVEETYVYEE